MRPLIEICDVSKHFVSKEKSLSGLLSRNPKEQRVRAVDNVSFHLSHGEVLVLTPDEN